MSVFISFQHYSGISHSNKPRDIHKNTYIGNEEINLSLFAEEMMIYVENPMRVTKKLTSTNI